MTMTLYDLAGADPELRFSPHCWRARMAIAHKGLAVETIPWRFVEKDSIAISGQGKVPMLVDGDTVVSDSWAIARHLDEAYPNRPALFDGPAAEGLALFVKSWSETVLHPALVRLILMDIFNALHSDDQPYFRETREKAFGTSLEAVVAADPEGNRRTWEAALKPLQTTLRKQPYLAGGSATFADYIVFGVFQWARTVSSKPLLPPDDPVAAWRDRLLDAFDGLARKAKCVGA